MAIAFVFVVGVPLFLLLLGLATFGGGIVGKAVAGSVGAVIGALLCGWWTMYFLARYGVEQNTIESGCMATQVAVILVAAILAVGKPAAW